MAAARASPSHPALESENHADAHDPRRAEKEKSLPPAFRRKQAGGAQRDGEQQILGQHVWILQCRIDPGRDRNISSSVQAEEPAAPKYTDKIHTGI